MACLSLSLGACGGAQPVVDPGADILLFNGDGAWRGSVEAIEGILRAGGLRFETADSRQLNAMSKAELQAHRLLIVPGGNFEAMGKGLTPETSANIREAVGGGMNYFGICAGAFLAGASPYNGLNLTQGRRFGFYSLESKGVRKSAVAVTIAGSGASDQYWEDGPELSGWGDVVGTYPDGTPAIVEGGFGKGWLILTGIHAEAQESWRRGMPFATPVATDNAYAAELIQGALKGVRLEHF